MGSLIRHLVKGTHQPMQNKIKSQQTKEGGLLHGHVVAIKM